MLADKHAGMPDEIKIPPVFNSAGEFHCERAGLMRVH